MFLLWLVLVKFKVDKLSSLIVSLSLRKDLFAVISN
jgi:hypothetical protein